MTISYNKYKEKINKKNNYLAWVEALVDFDRVQQNDPSPKIRQPVGFDRRVQQKNPETCEH